LGDVNAKSARADYLCRV